MLQTKLGSKHDPHSQTPRKDSTNLGPLTCGQWWATSDTTACAQNNVQHIKLCRANGSRPHAMPPTERKDLPSTSLQKLAPSPACAQTAHTHAQAQPTRHCTGCAPARSAHTCSTPTAALGTAQQAFQAGPLCLLTCSPVYASCASTARMACSRSALRPS
jgi:hypothetical protein